MTLPNDGSLLRIPKDFVARVLAGDVESEDLSDELSGLLRFARTFYLQFFKEEYDVEVRGFDERGCDVVWPIVEDLEDTDEEAKLLLASHFLTIAEVLEEGVETSAELDEEDQEHEVLYGVEELLNRIAEWAEATDLNTLGEEARKTHERFRRSIHRLL